MGDGYIARRGSGGASLNFNIVRYGTEEALLAAMPAENTIGIITEHKITSWLFSPSEPAVPEEGMLWIAFGGSGSMSFNALKKNGVILCPKYAKQYISGQWVQLDAWIYRGGIWMEWWEGWFYKAGAFWASYRHSEKKTPSTATIVYEESSVVLKTVAGSASEVYLVIGPVNLDDFATLQVEGTFPNSGGSNYSQIATIFVSKVEGDSYKNATVIATKDKSGISAGESYNLSLDVTGLSGEYYIHAGTNTRGSAWSGQRTLNITAITGQDSDVMAAKAAAYDILTEGVTT